MPYACPFENLYFYRKETLYECPVLFCRSEMVIFIFPHPPQREQVFLNSLQAEDRPVPLHLRQMEMIFMEYPPFQ
ncbi:hypothetical protein N288_18625 [Bacillus infantis NRRL B-14911]|uniref:Uncharacterized protein n=1 Tax=Bacillus infantis NRRL B-14911 TaxID=1367477 RepID=U5LCL6_9BACI|nr:hypothetical protein N288_18625 [Bacillus infantis NRRL B-14911]